MRVAGRLLRGVWCAVLVASLLVDNLVDLVLSVRC